jgi:branched-chain amino acid transport system permease protein
MVAVFGMSANTNISPGRGGRHADGAGARDHGTLGGIPRGAHRGHHTIMITPAIGRLLLFHQPELAIFGGHTGINTIATPNSGRRLASDIPYYYVTASRRFAISPFNMSHARRSASLQGAGQSPPHGRARFQCQRAPRGSLRLRILIAALGGVLQV